MDGNKDEALKCLNIGKKALEDGDRTRALKFVEKARRLDPNLPVDDLLVTINQGGIDHRAPSSNAASSSKSKSAEKSSLRHRVSANGPSPSSSSSSSSVACTEEQITAVREIRKKKDYYDILGLQKTCTVEDVRKAYRKLSLKVHPDKNKAPGAEEAFKAVSKAFQCLNNEEARKKYDLVGSDEPVYERQPASHGMRGFNGFHDDFDAEEIFRNFFYGGMQPTQFRGFSFGGPGVGVRTGAQPSGGFNARALIQLLPVILIILLNFLPSSDPIYSLSRSYPYEYKFTTQKGVNYYVKSTKFEQDYPPRSAELSQLEERIENDYFSILSQRCRHEMQQRHWGFVKEMPYCDMLKRYENVAG